MSTPEINEVKVRLNTIAELFSPPEPNPFEPTSRYEAGIDELAHQLGQMRLRQKKTRVVIGLPASALEPGLEEETRAAMARYCAAQIEANHRELQQLRRRGRFSLISAIIIILVAIGLVSFITWLNVLGEALETFLIGGLSVFSWVAVWDPFGIFLYEWRAPARNRLIFERLQQAELVIE